MSQPVITLVSCVAAKAAQARPAKDLYLSPLFKMARAYAEQQGGRWFILSAWWGLLHPDTVIAPYELTLNTMGQADRKLWANYVLKQLAELPEPPPVRVIFLAGSRYREHLMGWAGSRAEVPMEGLRIGEQLSWLKARTS
jgi:hypothetical protein